MIGEINLFQLVENVSEIEKVANHFGRSLTSVDVCSEKTDLNPKNKCRNRRQKYWFREIVGA